MRDASGQAPPSQVRRYLARIGRKGGRRSRRVLSSEEAKRMVKVREARRAFARFRTRCFWSFDPDLQVGIDDVPWVVDQLRRNGGHAAWLVAARLCR